MYQIITFNQQVQSKVTFPKEPNVSHACKSLVSRILVPQRHRLHINNIKNDVWLTISSIAMQTSAINEVILLCLI